MQHPPTTPTPGHEQSRLFDFRTPDPAPPWSPIDDVVMGGRSASRARRTEEGTLEFSGTVSLANGGGFASIRSDGGPWDLGGGTGLRIRYRGDGRTYRLRLRTHAGPDGVVYQAELPARPVDDGAWTTCEIPFGAFEPAFRGRPVPEAGPLDATRVISFGLLVGDGREGPFRLEVAWIELVDRLPTRGR